MDIAQARAWVQAVAAVIAREKDHLTQLDSAIGDADHGTNLNRGFTAVVAKLDGLEAATVGAVLTATGGTLISTVGGASGPLYGTVFRAAGKVLTEPTADGAAFHAALAAGLAGVTRLGRAEVGDKTLVDALSPAVDAFGAEVVAGHDFAAAAKAAADAAEAGLQATTPLQARKGRASYLGQRSVGHQDPGAASTALIFRALADVVAA